MLIALPSWIRGGERKGGKETKGRGEGNGGEGRAKAVQN